jgi:3-hydroxyacyl-[acyl-carrier-protein] dehydratase
MRTVPPVDGNEFAIDLTKLDFTQLVAGLDQIRAVNAQRFEMEMLSGVVLLDPVRHVVVGFKDLTENEFWVRGHMPNYPLMPGVLMLEAAAQLVSYYGSSQKIVAGKLMGLATIDEARFLRRVSPGERLVLLGRGIKVSRKLNRFRCEGYVGTEKAFEAVVTGVTLGDRKEMTGA